MRRYAGRLALAAVIAAAAAAVLAVGAAADEPLSVTVAGTDASRYPEITTILTADRGGLPLQLRDIVGIEVTHGGAAVDVRSVRTATDARMPLAVVLAMDASGSMRGATLERAVAAADGLIARLGPEDSVAVVAFGSSVQVLQALTTDHAAARRAVASIQATGNTRLFDGTARAIEIAAGASQPRRVVALLSDGEEFGSGGTLSGLAAIELARQAGPVVFSVGIGPEVDAAFLSQVAAASGGRYYGGASTDIGPIYEQLATLMRGHLVVEMVTSPGPAVEDSALQITVRTPSGSATTTARFSAPVRPATAPAPAAGDAAPEADPPSGLPRAAVPLAALALLAAGALAIVRLARAHSWRARGLGPLRASPERIDLPAAPRAQRQTGTLAVMGADQPHVMTVTGSPRVIGSGGECDLRVAHPDVAVRHARLWTRDGRLMVHRLDPAALTLIRDQPVEWGSVASGGELTLGTLTLRFALAEDTSAQHALTT